MRHSMATPWERATLNADRSAALAAAQRLHPALPGSTVEDDHGQPVVRRPRKIAELLAQMQASTARWRVNETREPS